MPPKAAIDHTGGGRPARRKMKNGSKSPAPSSSRRRRASSSSIDDETPHKTHDILTEYERVEDLNDFIWTMRDEPHASRRKELMKHHAEEIRPLMGYEWRTKWIVVALMAAQLSLAYHFREEAKWGGTLKFYLVAYFVGALITQALFLAVHEISHNLAFKKFEHNKLFGIFTNIPMVLPFFVAFKHYHNEHHKYQGFDGIDTDLPTKLEARLLSSTLGKLFFMFNQTWFYAFRPLFIRPQKLTKWHVLNASVQIAFVGGTVYYVGWGPILYLLLCAHFSGGIHPIASHFIAEHYVFTEEAETASYYGWMNYLTWNVGHHAEHHDFPTVPWSRLARLTEIGEYKSKYPHHASWIRVLWEFLTNTHVGFFNRVKRRAEEGEVKKVKNSMGAAKGDADYSERSWVVG